MIAKLSVLGFSLATALSGQALANDDCADGSKGHAAYRAPAGYHAPNHAPAAARYDVRYDNVRGDNVRGDMVELRQSDLNRDGRVTLAEALQHGRQDFRRTDRDRNRILTRYELPRGELAQEDRDRNGRISYEEHQAAVRWEFARYDANRDGVLARYELAAPHARGANWRR